MENNIDTAFAERKQKLEQLKQMRRPELRGKSLTGAAECPECGARLDKKMLELHFHVCGECGYHMKISARRRLASVLGSGTELFSGIMPKDPLNFPGYAGKLAELREKTGMADACMCMRGEIGGFDTVCAAIDPRFMMGSMGTAVGEKITCAFEYAGENGLPLIIFSASGGARMQEGIFSLMQMAKTAAAARVFSDGGGLFVSCLTNPTTGGVTASFAMLGDVILAEPRALIGFAGPRVIEQTIRAKLPNGFQSSEFQFDNGFVDAVVPRSEMRKTLIRILSLHCSGKKYTGRCIPDANPDPVF